ncbi:MAG: hypothetical protein R6W95_02175, partial [Desulfosarcina sp.]
TVREAVEATGANASVLFVPARFTADSACEAMQAGIPLIITVAEHVPVHDMLGVYKILSLTQTSGEITVYGRTLA